jgi:hypothetical protein
LKYKFDFDCFVEYPTRKSVPKRDDFGIVHIVKEATPVVADYEKLSTRIIPPVMDTIVQQTFVSPAKLDLKKLDEHSQQQQTVTATEQLAAQTAQMVDDICK